MFNASKYLEKGLGVKIGKDIADMINSEASFVEFPAKHIVLLEGMRATRLYFIISGIVRGYYTDEQGNDVTKCFSSENEIFSSEGLWIEKPSSFTIECLEDCACIQFSYEFVHRIMNEDDVIKSLIFDYYLKIVRRLESKAKNSALLNAKEQYIEFGENYPHLHSRVELKYIASYIGIRPASLSRIRKEMKNNSFN
ncbi:putative transcriptional regulator, Crp/Fnr family [Clostridium sp. DL-VIII]|uniref:Crp/Fnr family transcriptional regulator n=1 Tax=Clostridium sp. DL-VIII TaxID=641107 RepID=UPI00023AF685|nr:Crp/Fnr family transcriptional regulator [Clostridium sp. DL-VIII]EHI97381.1 putative transcriptional regulator, Crp/Fnr family [Clostridium sp. DL-VIII]